MRVVLSLQKSPKNLIVAHPEELRLLLTSEYDGWPWAEKTLSNYGLRVQPKSVAS